MKTNFHTNFRFYRVLGFVIEYAWISKLLQEPITVAFAWRRTYMTAKRAFVKSLPFHIPEAWERYPFGRNLLVYAIRELLSLKATTTATAKRTSLKKGVRATSNVIAFIPTLLSILQIFLELNSKRLYQSSGKEKESRCLVFTSSTKREIRHFHVVVVQRRERNVQKSVMHV